MVDKQLIGAIHYDNFNEASRLLAAGANVNYENRLTQETPLMAAVVRGNLPIAKLLIERRANVNHISVSRRSILYLAISSDVPEMVELLLTSGADANYTEPSGTSVLHRAAGRGNETMVELLLAHRADIKCVTEENCTILHYAASGGCLTLVRRLLESRIDVNCISKRNMTPLFDATASGHDAMVAYLLDNGADVNHTNKFGITTLMLATRYNKCSVIEQLLLAPGIDVTHIDDLGNTALSLAVQCGHYECAKRLAEYQFRSHLQILGRCTFKVSPPVLRCRCTELAILWSARSDGPTNALVQLPLELLHVLLYSVWCDFWI